MCCTRLAGNTRRENDAKNRHLRTIAQLYRAVSSQLRHIILTIGKKPVKQQYVLHMFSQYGELRPTNGWHRFGSLGALQQRASAKLCGVLQGNMEYLNFRTRRHLYSAGRPSRWASAYILVFDGVIYQKVIFEIVCRPITSSSNYIDITCISRWRIARERWSDFDVLFHANKVFTRGRLYTGLLFNTILNGSLQCPRGVVYILHYTPTVYN